VQHNSSRAELRIVVPEGPWEALVRDACPAEATLNVATVALDDLHQVLIHAVAEGRAPDLALLDSVWVPEFASSGFLLPLDELDAEWLDTEYRADVLDPFVRANRFGERTVAVQAEADVAGLWYRRDVLAAAGIDPPQTWTDLVTAGQVLLRMGVPRPLALPAGSRGGETTTYCLLGIQAANGAAVIDGDEVVLDSPGTVECLTFLHDLIDAEVLSVDAVSYEHDRAPRMLARSQAALSIGGSYEMRTLAAEAGLAFDDVWRHFGFVRPPQGPRKGSTLAGGMVHAIFRQASNPHLAMRLLQQLSSPHALARMSRRTGQLASRRSAAALAAQGSAFLTATAAMLEDAVVRPATRTYPRVSIQLQAMLEAVSSSA
jgi:multiple sugar transport system substrate-binding protein